MTKYEICKYIDEIRGAYPDGLTAEDIAEMVRYHSTQFEWLESFDDEQKARDYFRKTYQKMASTTRKQGWSSQYLYVEYYMLHKMEYDEDDEFAEGDIIDEIYEPLPAEEEK